MGHGSQQGRNRHTAEGQKARSGLLEASAERPTKQRRCLGNGSSARRWQQCGGPTAVATWVAEWFVMPFPQWPWLVGATGMRGMRGMVL